MTCLDASQIADARAGRLTDAALRTHLDGCARCRERLEPPTSSELALDQTLPLTDPLGASLGGAGEHAFRRGELLERYVVLDLVGAGAMGAVYGAYDPELDRKVALKLLRTDAERHPDDAAALRTRMIREGQAMARLSHPSVITIFDVGTHGAEIFIAMEFVDGGTLRDWMEPRRPWREVLALLLRAGAGLQAAHDAGIVHRDFKPDNVLVGAVPDVGEPRVRVTDFGLAVSPAAELAITTPDAAWSSQRVLGPSLTVSGSLLGTPVYMAPEQMIGQSGPRADQFSFCVTLYEALYGERPFAGGTVAALAEAIDRQRIGPPPAGAQVPRWLRRVVLRGLRADPAQRFPSMAALLAALRANPARRVQRGALVALGLAAVVVGGLGWRTARAARALECGGGERALIGSWDAPRRVGVAHAFLATGVGFAPASLAGTTRLLDDYAGAWTTMHRAACEATRVRQEQSAELLDLRMLCLDDRRKELRALVDVYAVADAETVEHAAAAARALSPIDGCANTRALSATVPPPRDPVQSAAAQTLHDRIDEVLALDRTGKWSRAHAAAQGALVTARAIGYAPRVAKLAYVAGVIDLQLGQVDDGVALLHESAREAERAHSDDLLADAWTVLVYARGLLQGHSDEALRWASYAHAALERAGGDEGSLATLLDYEGQVLAQSGRAADGLIVMRRMLAIHERVFGKDDLLTLHAASNAAVVMAEQGRLEDARDVFHHAMDVQARVLGPTHPDTLLALENYGAMMVALERGREVSALLEHGLAALRQLGPTAPATASGELNLAEALAEDRRYAEAAVLNREALAVLEPLTGGVHPFVAEGLTNLGIDALGLGTPGDAVTPLERALAIHDQLKSTPSDAATTRFALARALVDRDPRRARGLAEAAHAAYDDVARQFGGHAVVRAAQVASWLAAHPR